MLGSGTPNADPDHSGPAVAIVVGLIVVLLSPMIRRLMAGVR